MTRLYGQDPFSLVLVHGGPGAAGSMSILADNLSEEMGVIESLQTKLTIDDLIEELHQDIVGSTKNKVTLVGHSWGAMLSLLFTNRYPKIIERLILIGCPPLTPDFSEQITSNRFRRLSPYEAEMFNKHVEQLAKISDSVNAAESFKIIEELTYRTDNYSPLDLETIHRKVLFNPEVFGSVWSEAEKLRRDGKFSSILGKIKVPIFLIHGTFDPHPVDSVIQTMKSSGAKYTYIPIENCGHTPFFEKSISSEFHHLIQFISTFSTKPVKYTGKIPACGVYCGNCPSFTKEKNPCSGAEFNSEKCKRCKTFHQCCEKNGITHCYQCKIFPCTVFKTFSKRWLKHGQNFIQNQKIIKTIGEQGFLKLCR